jgi:hypothetical protein
MTNPLAADCRRATALAVHYGNQDVDGVNSVLVEAIELDRAAELIVAVLELHAQVIPILLSGDGLACLTQMIHSLSQGRDGDDPDCARAARLIVAHSEHNFDAYDAVLLEAGDAEGITKTFMAILATFRAFVPLLYSELGLTVLQRSILDWAAREDGDDAS